MNPLNVKVFGVKVYLNVVVVMIEVDYVYHPLHLHNDQHLDQITDLAVMKFQEVEVFQPLVFDFLASH